MDPLDVGILRELSRDQILWFGRIDPRVSAADIARRLRVDRATVSSRLNAWERQGFLLGHEVVPSPLVFGARIAGGNLRVDELPKKPRILEDLSLVPGLISAVDHVGDWVALLYAFDYPDGLERARRLIERLSGVGEVTPCVPFRVPEPTMTPTRLDFRILEGLRTGSRQTFQEIAKSTRISTKSLSRRMEQLVRGRAVWYLPILDFARYGKAVVARFVIALKPTADSHAIAGQVSHRIPNLTYLTDSSLLAEPGGLMPPLLDVGAHLETVGQAENIQQDLRTIDSVDEVEVLFPRRFHLYRSWFDDHLRRILSQSGERTRAR